MSSTAEAGRRTLRVVLVAGARPNFMKIAPIHSAMRDDPFFEPVLVHTGQHYDDRLSRVFFTELGLPEPALNLEVGSGSHAAQTAEVMIAFERALDTIDPDVVIVVGDVNSTLGAALVTQRNGITLCHVEAGLRSGDRGMPEEINRVLTDQLADWLYTPSEDCEANLLAEGVAAERIVFVGNVMIDSLTRQLPHAEANDVLERLGLESRGYVLVTLHRPSNVDDPAKLRPILEELARVSARIPVVYPAHPRAAASLAANGDVLAAHPALRVIEPQPYLAFLKVMNHARVVVTDSGGIQEETTFLDVPCLTVRATTERPITITAGTNRVVGTDRGLIRRAIDDALAGRIHRSAVPRLWDGRAARRVVRHLGSCGG